MSTKQILLAMHIIIWVVFFGVCIKTGAILYSFIVSLFFNPEGAKNLHMGLNLSALYHYSREHYISVVMYLIVISALKAYICYLVIKIFLKINLIKPFSKYISSLISRISHVAIWIGALALIAGGYSQWLENKGAMMPDLKDYAGSAAEFLFFGGIIFIISLVFKRGIEIQTENELTV